MPAPTTDEHLKLHLTDQRLAFSFDTLKNMSPTRIFLTLESAYPLMIRELTRVKEERKTFHAGLILFCTLRIQQLKRPLHFKAKGLGTSGSVLTFTLHPSRPHLISVMRDPRYHPRYREGST